MWKRWLSSLVLVLACAPMAKADTVSAFGSVALKATNWAETITVPKFNPALGTLLSVHIELSGRMEGDIRVVNEDNVASPASATLQGDIALWWPDNSSLLLASISYTETGMLPAGDSWLCDDISGLETDTYGSPPPIGDLAKFIGPGMMIFPVTAVGHSTADGPGNFFASFDTRAAADVLVVYTYTSVPLPAAVGLALPLLGFVAYRRLTMRKRR